MFVVGERINSSRAAIAEAIEKRNARFIQKEARLQQEAGAMMLDVNCATFLAAEREKLDWLISVIKQASNLPLCIDSPNLANLEAGLKAAGSRCLINSVTVSEEKIKAVAPLTTKYDAQLVILTMDEKGLPKNALERFNLAKQGLALALKAGIAQEKIFFDPLLRPIATETSQAKEVLETLRLLRALEVKTICGLSNVSFGLPKRSLINATFLSLCIREGLYAAILDPTDKMVMAAMHTTICLLGQDSYCLQYIQAFRDKRLEI
jgi:5-methyltetrahydrofolate--homocysteine methyltransferase